MSIFKRIIALFCSIAMFFSLLCTPAIAITGEEVAIGIGLFDLALNLYDRWKAANPNNPDSAYPGFNPGGAFGGGAGRHEAEQKYNDYVATLPSTGYTSDGAILWRPTEADISTNTSGQKIYYYAPPTI